MYRRHWLSRLFFVSLAAVACSIFAKDVGEMDILFAANNWLEANTAFWGDDAIGKPQDAQRITNDEGTPLPLWAVNLSPAGYIVFSADDTLPPVVAFSTKGEFSQASGTLALMLSKQGEIFQDALSKEKTRGDTIAAENLECWNALLSRTRANSITPSTITRSPMLATEWSQDTPFNTLCPTAENSNANAVTGCVAVAVSQVMKYHEWPVAGVGTRQNIDDEGDIQATIKADYSFPYNWSSIANEYDGTEPTSAILPLARLLMDAGTLGGADYEIDETPAFSSSLNELLPQHLNYSSAIKYGDSRRGYVGYTPQSTIYSRIKTDMTEGRPAILSFAGHAFVADGLGASGGKDYYHFNYGWGGYQDGWYLLTDGYESTVVITATTNILPKAVAVFKPLSVEQKSSFTLSWDFPKRITAQAFRLSRTDGTRATTVINDTISGTARSCNLTGQSGTYTYTLEAKVNGEWQPASEGATITVKSSPAALPTITMPSELTSIAGAQVSATITSSTTLKSLTVTSSRPDILPAGGISITGSGASRTVKLTPSGSAYGNVLLYVTATDNAGNVVKQTAMMSVMESEALVWHTTFAEAKAAATGGKYILMVAGRDTCPNTNYFRNTVCETSDIKANLAANYSLWYCNVDTSSDNYWPYVTGGGGTLPFIGIIDPAYLSTSQRYHGGFMGIEEGREFLDVTSPYFSLDDTEIYALGSAQTLEISVLDSGATIRYRKNATTPTTSDTLYSGPISLSATTTITARAFKNGQPIGDAVTKTYTFLEQVATPVLSTPEKAFFSGNCVVTATCATPGATIRYTTNGYFPDIYDDVFPAGGLTVTEETLLLVRAFKDGMKESEWVVSELHELEELPEAANIAAGNGISFHYAGEPWFLQTTTYNSKPSAMQSGAITDDGITTMVAKVTGPGSISFYWKASSEYRYDTLSFSIDGETLETISGETSWAQKTFDVTGSGDHYLAWTYEKDYMDSANRDCAWVDDIVWTPSGTPEPEPIIFEYEIVDDEARILGLMEDYHDVAEIVIPAEIEGYPVTQINEYAFEYNDNIISVTLPSSVTAVGYGAFCGCSNLATATLNEGLMSIDGEAFSHCSSLTAITLPASLTEMGSWVFDSCSALKEIKVASANASFTSVNGVLFNKARKLLITYPPAKQGSSYEIPATVTEITTWAFNACLNLSEFKVASANTAFTAVGGVLFSKDKKRLIAYPAGNTATQYSVPTTVAEICDEAFDSGVNLVTITVPDGVTEIGQWAFGGCEALESITLSNNLTALRNNVFSQCYSLTSLVIPDSVTVIQEDVFGWEDSPITELVIGNGVEEIYEYAFEGCADLETVYTDNEYVREWFAEHMPDVEVLGVFEPYDTTVDGVIYHIEGGEATVVGVEDEDMTEAVIQSEVDDFKVTAIGDGAFCELEMLESIVLPEGLRSIGSEAFMFCEKLEPVTLPASLEEIGEDAFWGCTKWTSITVSDGNKFFKTVDGVLYNAEMTDMLAYPAGRIEPVITIPDGVTTVSASFYYPENPLYRVFGVVVGNDLEDADSMERIFGSIEDDSLDDDDNEALETRYYLPDLRFVQTDNEALIEWLAANRPELAIVGMDEDAPICVVDGIIYCLEDDEAAVIGVLDYGITEANVVSEVNGITVTSIGDGAFEDCENLTSVTLPNGIKSIGKFAFAYCESLASLTLPSGITTIGDYAFENCISLTYIKLPQTLTSVGKGAFENCSGLNSMALPVGIEAIPLSLFYGCSSLETLYIRGDVQLIEEYAFEECESLTTVYTDSEYVREWFAENMPHVTVLPLSEAIGNVYAYNLHSGWNLITPTLELDDDSVATLLGAGAMALDTANHTYRWANAADCVPGTALWLFVYDDCQLTLSGDLPKAWTLNVPSGWNLIGAVEDLARSDWPKKIQSVFEWSDSEFREVDYMEKGKAYWVLGK